MDIEEKPFIVNHNSPAKDDLFWKETNKEISICLKYDNRKTTFVDIGSNEGIWSMLLNKTYADVHSFEPIKNNFNHLKHNLSNFSNVKIYNSAISDKKEKFEMVNNVKPVITDFNCGMTARKENFINAMKLFNNFGSMDVDEFINESCFFETVRSNTLDSYSLSPSLIKIDVENDEIKVLNGAKKTIEKHSPVLYVEDNFKPLSEKLKDTISSMNYVAVPEHPWIHIRK